MEDWPFQRDPVRSRPNWVASVAADDSHRVDPLATPRHGKTVRDMVAALTNLPRTRIVEQSDERIRAEVRSLIFRFVDDVEVVNVDGVLHILSASRLGHSDLGVNRRRVESLRRLLHSDR